MTDLNKIEVQIKTGPNAPDEHRIFLGFKLNNMPFPFPKTYIRAREFRLRLANHHSAANPFKPNTTETLIFGDGANVANPSLNDPRNPKLLTDNIIGAYIRVSPGLKESWKILGGPGNTFVKLNNDATHLYTLGADIILQEDLGIISP